MLNRILNKKKQEKGFTIIEVMIVLAIAGLIMVVVLVAVPQLQRNQRNSARKSVLARISAEVNNYISNNEGLIPREGATGNPATTFMDGFVPRYIVGAPAGTFDKPGGGPFDYADWATSTTIAQDEIKYKYRGRCVGELPVRGASNRSFAIVVGLEGGAGYCVDNE